MPGTKPQDEAQGVALRLIRAAMRVDNVLRDVDPVTGEEHDDLPVALDDLESEIKRVRARYR